MSDGELRAQFLTGQRGNLFVLARVPAQADGRCVLIVPPFAEEMNKSRRMLADLGVALAKRGLITVLPDLYGTGDSAGEFREADWDTWRADIATTLEWIRSQGWNVTAMHGTRLGCILCAQVARDVRPGHLRTVFWHPVTDGQRFMAQFLRLRVAASVMTDRKESVSELKNRMQAGELVEVAGYELHAALVAQIEAARLDPLIDSGLGELHWMELVRDAASGSSASDAAVEAARAKVSSLSVHRVVGEQFWASTEIVRVPELVARTAEALASAA